MSRWRGNSGTTSPFSASPTSTRPGNRSGRGRSTTPPDATPSMRGSRPRSGAGRSWWSCSPRSPATTAPTRGARPCASASCSRSRGPWAGTPTCGYSRAGTRSSPSGGRRTSPFPRDSRRSSRCVSTHPTASGRTRSGGSRSHDPGAQPGRRADRRRAGVLGRLARSAVPPGDGRADRLSHDGLPGRSDHVHPAEAEVARPVARVRQGLRAADGAHPADRRRAGHQGHGQRGRCEPARLRPGRRRCRAPPQARRQAAHRGRDGGRSAGPLGRPPGPGARAEKPRYGPAALRRTRSRARGQRLPRGLARGRRAAPRRGRRHHGPRHRHRPHAGADDPRLRLASRCLGPARRRHRGGSHDRVRRPMQRRQLPRRLGPHPRPRQRGYPIVEARPDGTFEIAKHPGTGGRISVAGVTEQLVYEMGDPAAYITPDCIADFTTIRLEQAGKDRVRVSGVRGKPATDKLKVSVAYFYGYKAVGTLVYAWPDAYKKARAADRVLRQRLEGLGLEFAAIHTELVGADATHGHLALDQLVVDDLPEVQLRIGVRSRDLPAVERFTREIAPLILNGPPSVTGFAGGRPKPEEIVAYWPALLDKSMVEPCVELVAV